ncbi:unnamed protein product [Pedinophyceae sp. YPF-701]|nr:unnamed protein product [Pedinophyceae sp. YPF-701]
MSASASPSPIRIKMRETKDTDKNYTPLTGDEVRWYYSTKPFSKAVPEVVSKGDFYRFCDADSRAIEAAFQQDRHEIERAWWAEVAEMSLGPDPGKQSSAKRGPIAEGQDPRPPQQDAATHDPSRSPPEDDAPTVAVKGGLSDVHLPDRRLTDSYWPGPAKRVLRGTWFVERGSREWMPLREDIAEQLEEAFRNRVWRPSSGMVRLRSSGIYAARVQLTSSARATGVQHLHALFAGVDEMFLCYEDAYSKLRRAISFRGDTSPGLRLRRGYKPPEKASEGGYERSPTEETDELCSNTPVKHLVLVVHGVGQRMASASIHRDAQTMRRGIYGAIRGTVGEATVRAQGRIEVLPVQWRKGLELTGDRVVGKLIPHGGWGGLRELVTMTSMDVLYYLSPAHCQQVMDSVTGALNGMYRHFKARNPDFDGSVHIVAHSLGSVVCFDILSNQPRLYSRILRDLEQQVAKAARQADMEGLPLSGEDKNFLLDMADVLESEGALDAGSALAAAQKAAAKQAQAMAAALEAADAEEAAQRQRGAGSEQGRVVRVELLAVPIKGGEEVVVVAIRAAGDFGPSPRAHGRTPSALLPEEWDKYKPPHAGARESERGRAGLQRLQADLSEIRKQMDEAGGGGGGSEHSEDAGGGYSWYNPYRWWGGNSAKQDRGSGDGGAAAEGSGRGAGSESGDKEEAQAKEQSSKRDSEEQPSTKGTPAKPGDGSDKVHQDGEPPEDEKQPPGPDWRLEVARVLKSRVPPGIDEADGLDDAAGSSDQQPPRPPVSAPFGGLGRGRIRYKPLDFEVDRVFWMGSPLGLFLAIRGFCPEDGHGLGSVKAAHTLPALFGGVGDCLPAVRRMYNIYHPYDGIAYRLEPLADASASTWRPMRVPYFRGGKRIHHQLYDLAEGISEKASAVGRSVVQGASSVGAGAAAAASYVGATSQWIWDAVTFRRLLQGASEGDGESKKQLEAFEESHPAAAAAVRAEAAAWDELATRYQRSSRASAREGPGGERVDEEAPGTDAGLRSVTDDGTSSETAWNLTVRLTEGPYVAPGDAQGRMDFVLQDSPTESQYLSALGAHFVYWEHPDVALFIARGIYGLDVMDHNTGQATGDKKDGAGADAAQDAAPPEAVAIAQPGTAEHAMAAAAAGTPPRKGMAGLLDMAGRTRR